MKGITVVCGGYNEEKRAELFFKSISMFDEIIFFDRGCTDKTCEIARKYNAKILTIPHAEPEKEHLVSIEYVDKAYAMVSNEWVISLTFADIVHPKLYDKLIKVINKDNFNYTVVKVPWVEYLFGAEDEYIPRCHYSRPVLRRTDMVVNSVVTHKEMSVSVKKEFTMLKNKKIAVHHMTYFDLQYSFKEQHVRYGIKEVETYYSGLEHPKREVWKRMNREIKDDILRITRGIVEGRNRKTIIHGIMISIYRSVEYYLAIYLILWAKEKRQNVDEIFTEIYKGLQKSTRKRKIPKKQLWNMWKKVFAKASVSLGADIVAFISTVSILKIMTIMYIWDNKREESPEEIYSRLKKEILSEF